VPFICTSLRSRSIAATHIYLFSFKQNGRQFLTPFHIDAEKKAEPLCAPTKRSIRSVSGTATHTTLYTYTNIPTCVTDGMGWDGMGLIDKIDGDSRMNG
jgi:hypothetical protein